jgi:hypothetical protein
MIENDTKREEAASHVQAASSAILFLRAMGVAGRRAVELVKNPCAVLSRVPDAGRAGADRAFLALAGSLLGLVEIFAVRRAERFAFAIHVVQNSQEPGATVETAFWAAIELYRIGVIRSPLRWMEEEKGLYEELLRAARDVARRFVPRVDPGVIAADAVDKLLGLHILVDSPVAYVCVIARTMCIDQVHDVGSSAAVHPQQPGDEVPDVVSGLPRVEVIEALFAEWREGYAATPSRRHGAQLVELIYFDGVPRESAYEQVCEETYPGVRCELVAEIMSERTIGEAEAEARARERHRAKLKKAKERAQNELRRFLVERGITYRDGVRAQGS